MSRRLLERIQSAVVRGNYDLTYHAVDEMAEDHLCILDIECAILDGVIRKTETDDPRGPRYTIVGTAVDGKTPVGVVGRFKETGAFLIITVFEVADLGG